MYNDLIRHAIFLFYVPSDPKKKRKPQSLSSCTRTELCVHIIDLIIVNNNYKVIILILFCECEIKIYKNIKCRNIIVDL